MNQRNGILVVDDTLAALKLLAELLQKEGYTVRPTNSGESALESIRAEEPELILLDIWMPEMNGFDVCRLIKENPSSRDIPVLFISATSDVDERVKGFALGAVDFITKPFQREELLARIRTHLELSRLQRRLESAVEQRTGDLQTANRQLQQQLIEQKTTEDKLRSLVKRYDAILSTSQDGFWVVGADGKLVEVNQAYLDIIGYSREEALSMYVADIEAVETPEEVEKHIQKILTEGRDRFKTSHKKKNGQQVELEVTVSSCRLDDGLFFFSFLRDITNQVEMEKRLNHAQKMEAIGTLAGGIAHDFNNILSIILGNAELSLLLADNEDPQAKEICEAVFRGRELVRQLLTFSRHTQIPKKHFDPIPMVKEALKFLRSTLPTSIEIQNEIEPSPWWVYGDPTQLHQVIMNLCTNSSQAMGEEGGVLTLGMRPISLHEEEAKPLSLPVGNYLELQVSDSGHGMVQEVRERIFEPFFTTKEVGKGTGLGLAVVHGAIQDCGGAIRVESEIGRGSTFKVYLPATMQVGVDSSQSQAATLHKGKGNILFVDDEPALVAVGIGLLQTLGYRVEGFSDPRQALTTFMQQPDSYQAVITDQVMPTLSGDLLATAILQVRPTMPIFLCTGYSERINESRVAELGLGGYFLKPVAIETLSNALKMALR